MQKDVLNAIANMEDKKDDNNDDDEGISPTNIFNTKKPKDAMSGAADVSTLHYAHDMLYFLTYLFMHPIPQGFGNIMKGVFGGCALVVAAPVKGAYDGASGGGGALGELRRQFCTVRDHMSYYLVLFWINAGATKGFFGGLAMGVAGGAALAVGGVATGVAQVARGIYHTPGECLHPLHTILLVKLDHII